MDCHPHRWNGHCSADRPFSCGITPSKSGRTCLMVLAFTVNDHWQPGIGDPTLIGWLTAAAYFLATFFCWRATLASRRHGHQSEGLFWFLFTGFLLFLGFNKQLDLQTWFTLFGKHLAEQEGWYAQRRVVQAAFIVLIGVLGICVWILLWRLARNNVQHHLLALAGGVFLGCFILIRAASFHYVDQ